MLTKLGKVSAMIIIAGGATMLQAKTASADGWRPCSGEELTTACNSAPGNYQEGQNWYCGYYAGDCMANDTENGTYISWSVHYYFNGPDYCPISLPC